MSAQTCARCGEVRPAAAFAEYAAGICRSCWNEKNREWKRNNQDAVAAQGVKRGAGDPIEFSRSTCKHVASYLERAKESFEKQTGTEAPPFIDAILSVTQTVLREHPVNRRCNVCASPIARKSRSGLCRRCAAQKLSEQKAAKRAALQAVMETDLVGQIRAFVAEHGITPRKKDIFPDLPPYWLDDWSGILKRAGYASRSGGRPHQPVDFGGVDGDIVRLYTQGLGYKVIATQLGLSRHQVRDRLRGKLYPYLPPRRRPRNTTLRRLPDPDGGSARITKVPAGLRCIRPPHEVENAV